MLITPLKFAGAILVFHITALLTVAQVRLTIEDTSHANAGLVTQTLVQDDAEARTLGSPVRRPVLGYIFHQEVGRIQPIWGIPGSASTGATLELGAPVSLGEVSPRHDFALAVAADSAQLVLVGLRDEDRWVQSIPKAVPGVDGIAISPSGASAALYSSGAHILQILTGLPDAPSMKQEINLSSVRGSVSAMAVSDDASVVMLAVTEGKAGSLFALQVQDWLRLVSPANHISSISFLVGSHAALVAAYEDNQVFLIHDVTRGATVELLADERDGVSRPVAVAASRDGGRAFAANSGTATILAVPLVVGQRALVHCPCRPSRLQRLLGNDIFLVTSPSDGSLFVFDGSSADSRILVVPFGSGSNSQTSESRADAAIRER